MRLQIMPFIICFDPPQQIYRTSKEPQQCEFKTVNSYLFVQLPEQFERFLVNDVEDVIVQNVQTDHSN